MNRLLRQSRLVACFVLLLSFVFITACQPRLSSAPKNLVIYHTNDIHGYAAEERDDAGTLTRVGYPRLKKLAEDPDFAYVLLLDAGDMLHGQPLATAKRGEYIARLLQPMKYDALAVGNHEFDYGLPRLLELREKYNLPFVAANVRDRRSGRLIFPPYIVKNFKTFKVGIFGLSSPDTPTSTSPANVASLSFSGGEEMAAQAREIIRTLKTDEKVDVLIALTHLGTEPYVQYSAQWLAAQAPGIDYIIDGHSHSEVRNLMVGDTLIASTGAFFHNVGRIFTEPPASPESRADLLPAATLGDVANDPKIAALLEKMRKELAREMAAPVGRAPFELEGRREIVRNESSNLGRLITAAMMKYTGADAALFNSGSIRASIPAGEITRGRLLEVLPFGNYAVTVKLRGSELRKVIRQGLSTGGSGGFLQFSGLTVTADKHASRMNGESAANSYTIRSISIGGKPLANRAEYTVAINDFMNAGGDGYELLKKQPIGEYETVEEMLLKYIGETPADELSRLSLNENLITGP